MILIKTLLLAALLTFSLSANEKVNVNFSDLQINDFVKLVSKTTHKNILINNRINGTVNFVGTAPVYSDELIGILVSVLESKGYTLIKKGSIYEIIRSSEAAKHNAKVITQGKHLYGSLMVTQSVHVKRENVDLIAAKIRYLLSKTAKLMTMKESNTLIITDYPKNIETIKRVIKDIDKSYPSIVKMIPIKHANARKLQTRLVNIAKSIFNQKVLSEAVKIVFDDNTNSLVVVGIEKNVARIEELIKKMDVESYVSKGVQIYELKNSDAKTVATSLNAMIAKQAFRDQSLKPNISYNDEINAIIAIGDPVILKGIKAIIDELDKEKYQVYVKAKIVEINKKDSSDIGVKYGFAVGSASSSGIYAMSTNFGDAKKSNDAYNILQKRLGDITKGTISSALALGATIDFLEENGASTSISNPSILCVNNKESSIYVGRTISISTGSFANSSGIASAATTYKREDVGLTLKIKPRVSSNDKVTLDIEASLENVVDDGSKNATGQPVTSKQEVKTQAILRHGESIIIGGLVKNSQRDSLSKLPLLGDIPWLGEWLFSSKSTTDEQDNLIVILTPYVIDKSANLSRLQKNLGMLDRIQKEYNSEVFKRLEEERKKKIVKKEK